MTLFQNVSELHSGEPRSQDLPSTVATDLPQQASPHGRGLGPEGHQGRQPRQGAPLQTQSPAARPAGQAAAVAAGAAGLAVEQALCPRCGGSGTLRHGDQRYRTCLDCLGQGLLVQLISTRRPAAGSVSSEASFSPAG